MSINLLSDTIDKWREMVRELDARKDHRAAEQARNWLFGAGLALQIMDVEALMEMSKRALEASENEHIRNRTVGAGAGDNMGISGVDNQREDLADGGAER
jgi:hypothetical protein